MLDSHAFVLSAKSLDSAESPLEEVTGGDPLESFAALFKGFIARQNMRAGAVISAEVVRIDHNFVIVDAGLKSEAYIPREEFMNDQSELEVQVGDFVSVAIELLENGRGDTVLSRDKAKRLASWLALEKALDSHELVTGTITGKVKGGMTVMVNGIRAFLPGSLIDAHPVTKDMAQLQSQYEGKTLEFRVIKLDRKRNNVVLSRRAVVEAEQSEERAKLFETLEEGAIVKGVVKNITNYGAFVRLAGTVIDGLLHITDIAWRRVLHPSEVLTVGQELTVKILKFDKERKRVSLGLKQLTEDPWKGLAQRYPSGTRLFGKVTNITEYGAFIEIEAESGIEGLVHASEMDWTNKNVVPSKVVQIGDEVGVEVLDIDEQRRRISLGMKQCKDNPWESFNRSFKRGDKVTGVITSITDFGLFIGLPGDIDGLIYSSELTANEGEEEVIRKYKKGDTIEAIVLSIDVDKERVSLGIKPADDDHFAQYISLHGKGEKVEGQVKSEDAKGFVIALAEDVEGYLRVSESEYASIEQAREVLKDGATVSGTILNVDRKARRVFISQKGGSKPQEAAKPAAEPEKNDTTNFGALLKAELNAQK